MTRFATETGHFPFYLLYCQVVFFLTSNEENELVHCEQFKREGKIAGVAKNGHLEDLKETNIEDGIVPFRESIIVPHFPQKATT